MNDDNGTHLVSNRPPCLHRTIVIDRWCSANLGRTTGSVAADSAITRAEWVLRRHQEAQGIERVAWGPSRNDAGLVFTREDGRPLRPEYATRHFQAIAKRAGLPAIRLHDLRHTSASLALAAEVEMKAVSDRLGHSQISTTVDLYTHVSRSLGRAAAEQIAGVLNAPNRAVPTASLPRTPENTPQKGDEAGVHP